MKDVKIHGVPLFTFCARGFKMAPSIVYVLPSRADHVKTHNAQSVLIHISLVKPTALDMLMDPLPSVTLP